MPYPLLQSLVVISLLLAGCATQQKQLPTEVSWEQHRDRMEGLEVWTAEGKLAVQTSELAESAAIRWQQSGSNTRLHLSGPMGVKATIIDSDGRRLEIRQGEQTRSWDLSDQAAITEQTGWDLPLQALPHWLRGVPAPDYAIQLLELNTGNTLLRTLEQDNWEIRFESYELFGDYTLPTRLRIQRRSTSARVIIREWQIPPQ